MTIDNRYNQLWESLKDPDYRKQFIDEYINVGIAFQIHGLRERQELTQKGLAERLGDEKKQPLISAWEDPNYGKYTLNTLKDLAKAFDVGLLVRFVPFRTLIDWTTNLTPDMIAPPNFPQENMTYVALKVSTSSVAAETKDKVTKAMAVAEFVNGLQMLDTFASTATAENQNIEEGIYA